MDAGTSLLNTASVTTGQTTSQTATATTAVDQDPSLTISKSFTTSPNDTADGNVVDHAGQISNDQISTPNTSTERLTCAALTDTFGGATTFTGGDTNADGN